MEKLPRIIQSDGADVLWLCLVSEVEQAPIFAMASPTGSDEFFPVRGVTTDSALGLCVNVGREIDQSRLEENCEIRHGIIAHGGEVMIRVGSPG